MVENLDFEFCVWFGLSRVFLPINPKGHIILFQFWEVHSVYIGTFLSFF